MFLDKTGQVDINQSISCQQMLDNLPFDVYAIDSSDNKILYGNHYFRNRYPDWKTTPCHLLVNGLDAPCPHCRRNELIPSQGNPVDTKLEYEYFNEFDECWYQMQERCVTWENGHLAHFVVAVDISDLKETQNRLAEAHAELVLKHKELERIASTDPLTQIYNREKLGRVFNKEMRAIERGEKPFSIISVDIDHFKRVNDTFGHATGDSVLITVARTMKNSLRATDYIGRWGGEEFLILCPETGLADALKLAERIRIAVSEQSYITGEQHTISIGVGTYRTGDTLDSLLHRSDLAMYEAKQTGRNRVCAEVGESP